MSAVEILKRISFSDGQPVRVEYDGRELVLDYRDWQERVIRLRFSGVAYFEGYGGSASLCEAIIRDSSPEIDQVRQRLSEDWGSREGWQGCQLTEFVIVDDLPLLRVIFESVEVVSG